MKQIKTLCLLLTIASFSSAQNINYEMFDVAFYRLPLKPLHPSSNTYSASVTELGADLEGRQRRLLLDEGLVIPGYIKRDNSDLKLELVISPLSVTNKEIKDIPLETEKDGKKNTVHQYWYQITFSFPTKIRVIQNGSAIEDQDLPGFFTADYHPQNFPSQGDLQRAYEQDLYFLPGLKQKQIEERTQYLKDWLASTYGKGMFSELVRIGYIKDKKGLYDDINNAFALMLTSYRYAHQKEKYLDDTFKIKINESIAILEKALAESSDDKKARIDTKVTAMIQYNIALCYYGLNAFDKADEHLKQIGKTGTSTMAAAQALSRNLQDRRARFTANGLLGSPEIVTTEVAPERSVQPVKIKTRDYIIVKPGDTLDVRFILPSGDMMPFGDSVWLQEKIIVTKKDKPVDIFPGEIHSYYFQGTYYESFSWVKDSNTRPWTFDKKFCKRIVEGPIEIFKKYEVENSFSDPGRKVVTTKTFYKKDGFDYEARFLNFNKGVSKLVGDYPELSERVKNGEFKREQFVDVVIEYNQWKRDKTKI